MKRKENDRLLDMLAAFSGVKIRHGKYVIDVKRSAIDNVETYIRTVVEVEEEGANNAPENKDHLTETANNAKE